MPHRIDIIYKVEDARAEVKGVQAIVDSYIVDATLSQKQLDKAAQTLTNPILEKSSIDKPLMPKTFAWAIEIGYKSGVTDPEGATAQESIQDAVGLKFNNSQKVYTVKVFFIDAKISKTEIQKLAESFHNGLIQTARIKSYDEFIKDHGFGSKAPKVIIYKKPSMTHVNLDVDDHELEVLGKEGIANADGSRRGPLALDIDYLRTIAQYFKGLARQPTDVELESLAQTWSEHCKHTIFADPIDNLKAGIFKTYIKAATEKIRTLRQAQGKKDFCVSVFVDNSGAIEFDSDYLITHKVETHNSPSALDPYGGAVTGIVGVNRDTIGFGLGAKPIINTFGFCFAHPDDQTILYRDRSKKEKMLSSRRILEGVVAGVNAGGNQSGIPTPLGFMYFHKNYRGKPLVFVGTVGLIPKKIKGKNSHIKKSCPGDYIVMVGGRVGIDGIHGATFSSEAIVTRSPTSAVQIGDPIVQKKFSDAIVKEARDLGLYNSITDNGAGGLSSSVGEMAKESGGCIVKLEKVPLKYSGLDPWQIWISESQERMTLAIPKNNWDKFANLMKRRGVEATVIGEFTDSEQCVVQYNGKVIMDIDMDFLHEGRPIKQKRTTYTPVEHKEPLIKIRADYSPTLLAMLSRANIASFEFISQQYDHEVQGGSVIKPLEGKGRVNTDATVVRPLLESNKGVVISYGINPTYSYIDTYHMAACAIDTAVGRAVCAGASLDHLSLLDNFCWGSSNEPEQLGKLKRAAQACFDYAVEFGTPFISGKDSMFNDFKGYDKKGNPVKITVPETLLISSIGVMSDITKAISLDFKFAGDLIYILGETDDELGASEYFAMISEKIGEEHIGNKVPKVDAKRNRKLYSAVEECINKELLSSSLVVARGGLAIAIAKSAIAGMTGVEISLTNLPGNVSLGNFALFSESRGRILVSIDPKNRNSFEKIMRGNSFALIGKVTSDGRIKAAGRSDKTIIDVSLNEAAKSYRSSFASY